MDKLYPNLTKVAFRFHLKDTTLEKVHNQLKEYKHHSGHIVAYELDAERPHYQGYILLSNKDPILQIIRKWVKKEFGLKGNEDYSLSKVKNSEDYKKYIIKEDNWLSSGFDIDELKRYQTISYPKKKRFQEEIDELEMTYLNSDMDDTQYLFSFFKLKAKYRQVINTNYAKQRLLMLIARKDDERLFKIAENISGDIKMLEEKKYLF